MALYHYLRQHGLAHTVKRLGLQIAQSHSIPPTPPTTYTDTYTWEMWLARSPWRWQTGQVAAWLKTHVDQAQVVESARHIEQGQFLCWGHQWIDFTHHGQLCWVRDPLTGYRWPNQRALPKVPGTDIKTVWEASRMDWTGQLIRAWLMTSDPKWPTLWWRLLEHWHAQPDHGVHWSNGQEIAIRALNMLWGAHIFPPSHEPFSRFERWCHQMAHAIAWHHPHTRVAINNNHVILEAIALYALALAFPRWPNAAIWQAMAQQSLLAAIDTQWQTQYIQRSHSYHRLALWALMWVRPQATGALQDAIDRTLTNAHDLLTSQQGKRHGRLPCFGPNDGACWPNIHTCDYRDYRPVIQCLRALRQESIDTSGPWAEAILWVSGEVKVPGTDPKVPGTFTAHHTSEHTTLRHNPSTFATMIHGPFFGPFGQDDQMHVDLTWAGYDVTLDRGSYRYTGFADEHGQHHGARGHNTVTIEQLGSRWPAGYFSWRNPARESIEVTRDVSRGSWCQAHRRGFVRAPQTSHTRKLTMIEGGWEIDDALEALSTRCQLRWILPHGHWSSDPRETSFILHTEDLEITCALEVAAGHLVEAVIQPTTWSPYYGDQQPAVEWICTIEPEGDKAQWTTTILPRH